MNVRKPIDYSARLSYVMGSAKSSILDLRKELPLRLLNI